MWAERVDQCGFSRPAGACQNSSLPPQDLFDGSQALGDKTADEKNGAAAGLILMLVIALFSRAIYKKWALGGADIKLFAAAGFLTGLYGVLIIFVLTTLLSALHFTYLLIRGKTHLKETRPMVPYMAIAFGIYFLFIKSRITDFILTI